MVLSPRSRESSQAWQSPGYIPYVQFRTVLNNSRTKLLCCQPSALRQFRKGCRCGSVRMDGYSRKSNHIGSCFAWEQVCVEEEITCNDHLLGLNATIHCRPERFFGRNRWTPSNLHNFNLLQASQTPSHLECQVFQMQKLYIIPKTLLIIGNSSHDNF